MKGATATIAKSFADHNYELRSQQSLTPVFIFLIIIFTVLTRIYFIHKVTEKDWNTNAVYYLLDRYAQKWFAIGLRPFLFA